jgi:hypothetical protein
MTSGVNCLLCCISAAVACVVTLVPCVIIPIKIAAQKCL